MNLRGWVVLVFRLLGEVEATGSPVPLGHARQRAVLAVLLVEVNQVVSRDALIDRAWGERLPRHPRDALYSYLSRLRASVAIDRRGSGYVLTAEPMSVDVHRFLRLADRAAAAEDDQTALAAFDEALGLWRGEPFAGLDSPWFGEIRERLARRRQAAELDRNDVRLRLGLHDRVLAEAPAATTTNERLAGQVMLALHVGGRQADALRYFERVRGRLAEELGTDPSGDLRGVHHQVLTAGGPIVPRQLPASPPSFTGRAAELARLGELLAASPVVVITGGGGMGKTWLALRWAHDNAHRFPDGQLYVNLGGFDPTAEPMRPATAVRGLLAGLGTAPAAIPAELDAQAALYRSMIAGRRTLVVLDNARDLAQVAPLLPGTGPSAVLVTSRSQLTGLICGQGAGVLTLPLLTDAAAVELLTRRLGTAAVSAEPEAVREITLRCAGLPLALGVAAARAATGPGLAGLAGELRSACLDALDPDEPGSGLRAVFSVSYRALDEETARAFRLLARAPGPDIGLLAAAHLLAPGEPARLVRRLTTAHLVRENRPGRFRMHDLVRLYAAELPDDGDGRARLLAYYRHAAVAAMRRFAPAESYRRPEVDEVVWPTPEFATFDQARDWLDTERANLVAAAAVDDTGRLAMTVFRYFEAGAHHQDALTLHGRARDATGPDSREHGHALLHLGTVLLHLGRTGEALEHHERALRHARRHGDTVLETCAACGMAAAHEQRQEYEAALEHYEHALAVARGNGHRHREGVALNNLGDLCGLTGQYALAAEVLTQGLEIAGECGDLGLVAYLLANLGDVYEGLGRQREGVAYLGRALELARAGGNRGLEVCVLNDLGRASGDVEKADRRPTR
ncbi:AfsR/SARP family transcriptional regulator [Actinophytocola xanthii]|uniref:Uncharacterized protein n=1 Tax=Actinophytocola xanthii TaxID=1912961 RepID=A0A1Q8BX99_9PSEU|nr:BTAD domain-containing putative transcriptional regulator [Actinophytocola xanthii]OLF06737.1 hypothetical protein BU204_36160 [Actinophytocola xanthii]